MKLAVTYENGNVFQHFGHTEEFKVYEIVEGKVAESEVVKVEGGGHGAIAEFLGSMDVKILICGGLGDGAKNALDDAGIIVFSGVEGNADEAVEKMLAGEIEPAGANCEKDEDAGCGGDCGSGCGGCSGGCGGGAAPKILFEGKNAGKPVKVHYTGTLNDGTVFDSSRNRGATLDFICGVGMMIPGFDKAVVDMEIGDVVDIHIMPEDAYGMPDPSAVITMEIAQLPGSENLEVGQRVTLYNAFGQPVPVLVTEKDDVNITLDANHEMAGKELNFNIELVSVE